MNFQTQKQSLKPMSTLESKVEIACATPSETHATPSETHATPSVKRASPPPPCGGYIEPCSHLVCKDMSADEIFAAILESFSHVEKECDVTIDKTVFTDRYRINVVAYHLESPAIPIVVRLFALEAGLAIEYQRRDGDLVVFADIWDVSRRYFMGKHMALTPVQLRPRRRRPAPVKDLMEIPPAQLKATLACLIQMAKTEFVDVKSQAIQALCMMSIDSRNRPHMVENKDCIDVLVQSIGMRCSDVDRHAFIALSNLGDDKSVAKTLCDGQVIPKARLVMDALDQTPQDATFPSEQDQVAVECLGMLFTLSSSGGGLSEKNICIDKALKSTNGRIRHAAERLKAALSVRTSKRKRED